MKNLFIGKSENPKLTFVLLEDLGGGMMRETFDKLIGGDSMKKICKELIKFQKKNVSTSKFVDISFSIKNLLSEMIIVETDSGLKFLKPLSPEEMQIFFDTYFTEGGYVCLVS